MLAAIYFFVPPVVVYVAARALQQRALVEHRSAGGRLANFAWAAWFGVACGIVTFVVLTGTEPYLHA